MVENPPGFCNPLLPETKAAIAGGQTLTVATCIHLLHAHHLQEDESQRGAGPSAMDALAESLEIAPNALFQQENHTSGRNVTLLKPGAL